MQRVQISRRVMSIRTMIYSDFFQCSLLLGILLIRKKNGCFILLSWIKNRELKKKEVNEDILTCFSFLYGVDEIREGQ